MKKYKFEIVDQKITNISIGNKVYQINGIMSVSIRSNSKVLPVQIVYQDDENIIKKFNIIDFLLEISDVFYYDSSIQEVLTLLDNFDFNNLKNFEIKTSIIEDIFQLYMNDKNANEISKLLNIDKTLVTAIFSMFYRDHKEKYQKQLNTN